MDQNDNNNFWDQPQPATPAQPTTPSQPTSQPTDQPTNQPTDQPTSQPSDEEIAEALKSMSNKEIIDLFVEGLIIDKGLGDLDDETKEEIRTELTSKVEEFLTQSLVNALSDSAVDEIDEKIESGAATQENIIEMIEEAGIDSGQVITDALIKFREIYLAPSENETEN